MRGKVVVVDFWATWCAPCKSSFPQLESLSKKVGDKVEIVGISVDDEKTGIVEFAKETGATFPIGWDEGHSIAERWKVKNMPTTFIVDGSGSVRFIHAGYHDGETAIMEKELASLVDGAPSRGMRVATADAKDEAKSEAKDEPKTGAKSDAKTDSKPESKSDSKTEAIASASSSEEAKTEAAPRVLKKKGPKKGGGAGGKAKPPKKAGPKKK
jgi:thiol-disulfide isomerase/thioredoxin